jgi:hypothetical protein
VVPKVGGSIPLSHPTRRFQHGCIVVGTAGASQGANGGSIPLSHPIYGVAGIVQWLVCEFSKLEMRVRFSLPAPEEDEAEKFGSFFVYIDFLLLSY